MPRGAWRDQPGPASHLPERNGDDAARWRDQPGRLPPDRAASGSREDLRKRLDHLPDWHPSSSLDKGRPDSPRQRQPERGLAADRGPDADDGGYWSHVPRFERMWTEHVRRWPDAHTRAAVDRSRDPEGSWRGSGNQYLDPEQHKRVQQVIDSVRTAEKPLSEHMREIERENSCGSRLVGWESRLKGDTRLKEKIADLIETGAPDAQTTDIVRDIPDAIRYTFCTDAGNYHESYWSIKSLLEQRGYTMTYSKNHWLEGHYKGINTRWTTPNGRRFELQFHTPESYHAKQHITHASYERVRNPLTSDRERRDLARFNAQVSGQITEPADVSLITNYRRGLPYNA